MVCEQFLVWHQEILPWIAEYSPYGRVTADDLPIYLLYREPPHSVRIRRIRRIRRTSA